ncbi:MAG: N-methyl-L-tryptophan oxidase [Phycisphaerae bacterium]
MDASADVIVIGLGAMGSATAYHLARLGARVIGLDALAPPHDRGSSHGATRITRLAIGEGAQYVPLVVRSHQLWREIEAQTGADLLTECGGLILGREGAQRSHGSTRFLDRTIAAARQFGIAHEVFDAAGVRRRFPQFAVADDERGYFEPSAGLVRPEACVAAQLELARRDGARLITGERVLAVEADGGGVCVRTAGATYRAGRAVITTGPWVGEFLPPAIAGLFTVSRQVLYWFAPVGPLERYAPGAFPIFIQTGDSDADILYGFPAAGGPGDGVKVATEQFAGTTTADAPREAVTEGEIVAMRGRTVRLLPELTGPCVRAITCLYTCTPDFGFVIDALPESPQILLVSPCSGHGFKHSAAIGEAIAEVVVRGRSGIDLAPFSLARFPAITG